MNERKPRRGDLLEVDLEGFDERGQPFGRVDAYTVRVQGGVPGSRVRANVSRRRRDRVEARLEEVLAPGAAAVEPRCRHFGTCGGCSYQSTAYEVQLEELGRMLLRILAPLGLDTIEPVRGARDPWHYRNKMDFTFGTRRWIEAGEPAGAPNGFAVGLHVPGRYDKILDVESCDIAFAEATPLLRSVRELARARGLEAWDVRAHAGLLRHLVLRKGVRTSELMVDLVTTEPAPERVEPLVAELVARHPEITTVVQRVDDGVALVARGTERVLHGPGVIHEVVDGLTFRISAASFFQTNTEQAEELVRIVKAEAAPAPGTRVFDLFCGSGLFSLALAREGAQVVGYELVEEAVQDARANAARNGLDGLRFVAGDLATTLDLDALDGTPEVCVVDPPRAGVHVTVLGALRALAPRRLVYVSCNAKSAVRDLTPLVVEDGYRVLRVQPVDLFPHTPHLECVFTLEAR